MIGLLHKSGRISRYYLDCSQDKFLEKGKNVSLANQNIDLAGIMEEITKTGDTRLDFITSMKSALDDNNVREGVKKLILDLLGGFNEVQT